MKYILFFLFLFFPFFIGSAFEFSWFSYSWELTNDSIISINWEGFVDSCVLSQGGKNIELLSSSNTKITFSASDLKSFSWEISINCDSKSRIYVYDFPYITSAEYDSVDKNIFKISWSGFWDNPSLSIVWWSYEILWKSRNDITLKFKRDSSPRELYLTTSWYKSNKILLNEKYYPTIHYIESESGFSYNNEAVLCGDNITKNDRVFIWDEKILRYWEFKFSWNCIKFKLPYIFSSSIKVRVENNFYSSNELEIVYDVEPPKLEIVSEGNYYDESRKIDYKALVLSWENLPTDKDEIEVYVNNRRVETFKSSKSLLYAKYDNIYPWINYIYAKVWAKKSNYVTYDNSRSTLKITGIDYIWEYESWYKFRVNFIWDFDEKNYIFKINNYNSQNISCLKSYCFVYYRWRVIDEWDVYISYRNQKLTNSYYFYWKKKSLDPYVTHISFPDWIGKNKIAIIHWENLSWINYVNTNNLFNKDEKRKDEYKISWSEVVWPISSTYREWSSSSISIRYWTESISFSFSPSQLVNNKLYLAPRITSISWEWLWFKVWDIIEIKGKWFSKDDILLLWRDEYPLSIIDNFSTDVIKFKIPEDTETWNITFRIKNKNNLYSNTKNIYVSPWHIWENIKIYKNTEFNQDKIYKDLSTSVVISSYIAENYLWDTVLDNVYFQILPNRPYQGTYSLTVNWRKYTETVATDKWLIVFKDVLIPFSTKPVKIELKKESPFIYSGNHKVLLNLRDTEYYLPEFRLEKENFVDKNMISSSVSILPRKIETCFTNEKDLYCKEIVEEEVVEEAPVEYSEEDKVEKVVEVTPSEEEIKAKEKEDRLAKYKKKIEDFMPKFDAFVIKKSSWDEAKKKKLYKMYYDSLAKREGKIKSERNKVYLEELLKHIWKRL